MTPAIHQLFSASAWWREYSASPAPQGAPYFTLLLWSRAGVAGAGGYAEIPYENSCMGETQGRQGGRGFEGGGGAGGGVAPRASASGQLRTRPGTPQVTPAGPVGESLSYHPSLGTAQHSCARRHLPCALWPAPAQAVT